MDIFEAARQYNFGKLQEYIRQGGNVNVCDENGYSLLNCFVRGYVEAEGLFDDHECMVRGTPLEKRTRPIERELNFLFTCGADPNLCRMVNGETETALRAAVCAGDYYLTEYLLRQGANPEVRLFEETSEYSAEYWLLEEMDTWIMDDANEREAEMAAGIAQLLWEYGLKTWSGFCIDMSPDCGVVDIHSINTRY